MASGMQYCGHYSFHKTEQALFANPQVCRYDSIMQGKKQVIFQKSEFCTVSTNFQRQK